MPIDGPRPVPSEIEFRCGAAARWLPRALAASLLASAMMAAHGLGETRAVPGSLHLRQAVVMLGAVLAVALVRGAAELRRKVVLTDRVLRLAFRDASLELPFEEIERLDFSPLLADLRRWAPATTLLDRHGRTWRLSAWLDDGDRLIRALVLRSGRNDLEAWAEALDLDRRMGRGRRTVAVGYGVAAAILAAGIGALAG